MILSFYPVSTARAFPDQRFAMRGNMSLSYAFMGSDARFERHYAPGCIFPCIIPALGAYCKFKFKKCGNIRYLLAYRAFFQVCYETAMRLFNLKRGQSLSGLTSLLVKKAFDKYVDREQAPPPLLPSPVFAKVFQTSWRKNCKETIFTQENGIFRRKNRPASTVHATGHD